MVLWCYGDMVLWRDSILLCQTCNTSRVISFYKHLGNTRTYDIPYSHVLKTHLENITE